MFVYVCSITSVLSLFATLWMAACQTPLCTGLSRQEYWSWLPSLLPGDLPNPGNKPKSLMSSVLADKFFTASAIWKADVCCAVLCQVTQPRLTLCNPMICSLPGSSVHGDSPVKNTSRG